DCMLSAGSSILGFLYGKPALLLCFALLCFALLCFDGSPDVRVYLRGKKHFWKTVFLMGN
ncbi:MAG: hypothetical protein U9R40_07770, partial [Synergistota bacterium]|nr:hypothetical protein [Synergistota bacterium]